MKLGGDLLVRPLAQGVGQVGKLALEVLELVLYLLHPRLEELIWVEWALVAPCADNSPIFVLVALRIVAGPDVAAAPVAWVPESARGIEVDELVYGELAVFHISIIQKLDGGSY